MAKTRVQQRFAAKVIYDGTAYLGFQRQKDGLPTIQGMLEAAVSTLAKTPITCIGAGRTDTGVHASGQVVSWKMTWKHQTQDLMNAVNAHLPSDIALKAVYAVNDNFHPRFDAKSRQYVYKIYISPTRDPLRDRFMWQRYFPLDTETMHKALMLLQGVHDFATFGQPPQGNNTVREMIATQLTVVQDELHIMLRANAFLQRMVRSIVGSLAEVGRVKMSLQDFEAAFVAADRSRSGPSAPACGLALTHVDYQNGW